MEILSIVLFYCILDGSVSRPRCVKNIKLSEFREWNYFLLTAIWNVLKFEQPLQRQFLRYTNLTVPLSFKTHDFIYKETDST